MDENGILQPDATSSSPDNVSGPRAANASSNAGMEPDTYDFVTPVSSLAGPVSFLNSSSFRGRNNTFNNYARNTSGYFRQDDQATPANDPCLAIKMAGPGEVKVQVLDGWAKENLANPGIVVESETENIYFSVLPDNGEFSFFTDPPASATRAIKSRLLSIRYTAGVSVKQASRKRIIIKPAGGTVYFDARNIMTCAGGRTANDIDFAGIGAWVHGLQSERPPSLIL